MNRAALYNEVCRMAMDEAAPRLRNAKVVVDGSGDREFRRGLQRYLRSALIFEGRRCVDRVAIKPSHSDPLLQAADYCAGVANRACTDKDGAEAYLALLGAQFYARRVWPSGE